MNSFARRDINWDAVFKNTSITPDIQAHLLNVYTLLAATILTAAAGSVVYLKTFIGGGLTSLVGILLLFWLYATPRDEVTKRISILLGFSFLQGLSIGPLIGATFDIDPSILTTAFFGTVCVFACFSASAYFAERRSYLFLGGILGTALTSMVVIGFLNIFFRSDLLFNISLYAGLIMFCGFVCFDTQLIIEKAAVGHKDFVSDALELFLDFIAIFVRLLIILSKNSKKKRKKEDKAKRNFIHSD